MRKFLLILPLILLGLIGYLFLFLPNLKQPKTTPPPPTKLVPQQEKVTESAGTLIENFPDVPVYPGLIVDKTYRKEKNGKVDFVGLWFYEGEIQEIMKWYADEFKKTGWDVKGPFIYEGEDELEINAENSRYTIRLLNTEREEGDTGRPGKLILVDIVQK